jgi:hypothetical protein
VFIRNKEGRLKERRKEGKEGRKEEGTKERTIL